MASPTRGMNAAVWIIPVTRIIAGNAATLDWGVVIRVTGRLLKIATVGSVGTSRSGTGTCVAATRGRKTTTKAGVGTRWPTTSRRDVIDNWARASQLTRSRCPRYFWRWVISAWIVSQEMESELCSLIARCTGWIMRSHLVQGL